MRGQIDPQSALFSYVSVEERIPKDHPLRSIKAHADAILRSMNARFESMYEDGSRPSIPPERLLKATLLIALHSIRSDRLFCEVLGYNILYRWFLDMLPGGGRLRSLELLEEPCAADRARHRQELLRRGDQAGTP